MKKLNYIQPNVKTLIVSSENLMDYTVSGSEADGDFDFAKKNNDFEDDNDDWENNSHSVWED